MLVTTSIEQLRGHLQAFDFNSLFVSGLGWNHYIANPLLISIDGFTFQLEPVAEKAGFAVFVCAPDADGAIPPYPVRRKIEHQVTQRAFEHLIVFADQARKSQIWQWVKREAGKPAAYREMPFSVGQSGNALLQRIQAIAVSLEEELQGIGIAEVVSRVRRAMDIERVTKRFYDRFRGELTAFQSFIEGVTTQGDREWYASLMLNRMMFIYFIQKQGFLDGDINYLRHRLQMVQAQAGEGHYQQFYRMFLRRLFHEGLGQPEAERAPELTGLLGRVPFLNGGLFDVHDLERDNPEVSIPDEAFERVFDFFDAYQWHLDDRPNMDDNEINPDVLGYIFEKYINQKQMGAYYTKEDITGYITQNTVIPFLFDSAQKECPVAFRPEGGVWRLLQDDPDRYIYPAVGHGMTWDYSPDEDPKPLPEALRLPDDIAEGIGDVSLRQGWNTPAPDEYALPTETWREVVARRKRYEEVRGKLVAGEVQDINDLITLNLDIERFAKDVITQSEGPELLRAFWHSLTGISVLDPTCGSGAFLFAALNVLEPLYTTCLEGMQGFLQDLEVSQRTHSPNALSDFRKVKDELEHHPGEQYFILKSIVLNNLYGVDIMEEATEICKLRLFLKLVAQLETYNQIEPLPDIDFNIRAGNTLVGFTSLDAVRNAMTVTPDGQSRLLSEEDNASLARINEEAEIAARAFDKFREQQTVLGGEITAVDKLNLRRRLDILRDELDRHLAVEYGVQQDDANAYDVWRASHQPFHWFVEFYGVMQDGGFDVIVGNPPYVEYSKVRSDYTIKNYSTERCGNLYAYVVERTIHLGASRGRSGMIIPHSSLCTDRMAAVQQLLLNSAVWVSSYDIRPAKLFEGVDQRLAIYLTDARDTHSNVYSSNYRRWNKSLRSSLFASAEYICIQSVLMPNSLPKVNCEVGITLLEKLNVNHRLSESLLDEVGHRIYFHNSPRYWIRATDFAPYFWNERDGQKLSVQVKPLTFASEEYATVVVAALNSSLFYWWFLLMSDCRHLNLREIEGFPLGLEAMSPAVKSQLAGLVERLMTGFKQNSRRKETRYRTTGKVVYDEFNQKPSKPIADEIDRVLAEHYGFTDEELDYIINYDIKFRMGRERN